MPWHPANIPLMFPDYYVIIRILPVDVTPMPIYIENGDEIALSKTDDKRGGKNNGLADGYYLGTNGRQYFIKQPQDTMELFTELFAGQLLQEFKKHKFVDEKLHSSLICADLVRMESGSYALIQPKVDFLELYHIIGTGYADGSDRNLWLEMFSGPSYYPILAQRGYYYGLSTCLMFSVLLGDYSVHSGNVVCISAPAAASSSSSSFTPLPVDQYAKIDWGASFRHFAHPENNIDLLTPFEYRGVLNYKGFTKGYLSNYRQVPGLYASIVRAAELFQNQINQGILSEIIAQVLRKMPADLLNQDTKDRLASYMSMPCFSRVSFGGDGEVEEVAVAFAEVLMTRLQLMPTLIRFEQTLSDSGFSLMAGTDTPFSAQMAEWKNLVDVLTETTDRLDVSSLDVTALQNKFNQHVQHLAQQAELFDLWPHVDGQNINLLAPYYNGDSCVHHGSAFLPYYRESDLLRRLYTIDCQSGGVVRLHHYELANKVYVSQVSDSYWLTITNSLNAGMGVINAIQLLQKPGASTMPELQQGFREQLQIFNDTHARLLNYLPQTSEQITARDFGSHCFYPVTDDELDAMNGTELAMLCLEELNATEPSPLVLRIVKNDSRWSRLAEAMDDGRFNERADLISKMQRLSAWRAGVERILANSQAFHQQTDLELKSECLVRLYQDVDALPDCFRSTLSDLLVQSVAELREYRNLQAVWQEAAATFGSARRDSKLEAYQALHTAYTALPDVLKPLFEASERLAHNEYVYLSCLAAGSAANVTELSDAYGALTVGQKAGYPEYQLIHALRASDCISDVYPVSQAHAVLQRLQAPHIDPQLQRELLDGVPGCPVLWQTISQLEQAELPVSLLQDLLRLKAFCDSRRELNRDLSLGRAYNASIDRFYQDVLNIRVSNRTRAEQSLAMVDSARQHFQHRHPLILRLFGDALLVISSLVGIGIYIGHKRISEGKSAFFSNTATNTKREFAQHWLNSEDLIEDSTPLLKSP
ncbi:LepB GTPase-activating domain-containing protein [Legionella sp. CNM-4043-24]|uniref:LepB GTPase-activating domain-containing protein n=1 Tax=Legionella sp. CNM-4043-24 TaxID=3421646 RepID=UPI00403AA388